MPGYSTAKLVTNFLFPPSVLWKSAHTYRESNEALGLEGREYLHHLFHYLHRYRLVDIYFVFLGYRLVLSLFIWLYLNFLNFILLHNLLIVLCGVTVLYGVWCSVCYPPFGPLPPPHVYTLILQISRFSFVALVSTQSHFYSQVLMYALWKEKS